MAKKRKNPTGIYLKEEFEFNPDFSSVNKKSIKGDKKRWQRKKRKNKNKWERFIIIKQLLMA